MTGVLTYIAESAGPKTHFFDKDVIEEETKPYPGVSPKSVLHTERTVGLQDNITTTTVQKPNYFV